MGFLVHLAMGQVFALLDAASFALIRRSTWWLGAVFGLFHGVVALTVLLRIMVGVHPRMASERAGPDVGARRSPVSILPTIRGSQGPST